MVSGSLSLPCAGSFSPFPHGTRTLSVSYQYLALPDGPGGFTQDSSCPALLRMPLRRCQATRTRLSRSRGDLSRPFRSPRTVRCRGPTTPAGPEPRRFGLLPGRSPLLGESLLFSSPPGTKMFQFPGFASAIGRMSGLQPDGLSHSEIRGSQVICTSPRLIAAYHVLHRL